jgi:hypothetical protein
LECCDSSQLCLSKRFSQQSCDESQHSKLSMSETNPYAPPATSEVLFPHPRWFRRDGKFVVVRTGAVLPARCVKTNEEIGEREVSKERQFTWVPLWARFSAFLAMTSPLLVVFFINSHSSTAFYTIGVPGILIAGFLPVAFQKRMKVTYALHRRERRWRLAVQGVAVAGGVGGWLFLKTYDTDSLAGFFALIGGGLLAGVFHHPLRTARHRDGEFWLKGCSPEFLDSLDEA